LNYKFLEAVLEKTGAKILHASNGQEVVDLVKTIPQIDLVLLDIKMPVKNGYEALADLKKLKSSLPVIAQTAYAAQEEMEKCLLVGCDDYITKPIDINLLSSKINRFFQA
jgi:CheY-like chemotaxis protein